MLWHHFHQNKDWNGCQVSISTSPSGVMTPLPPKQGLKRISHIRIVRVILRLWHHFHQNKDWNRLDEVQRLFEVSYDTTSTKTRIETEFLLFSFLRPDHVMTPLPPKQGLKQNSNINIYPYINVMTPLPPKQGLKLLKQPNQTICCIWLWHHFHQNKDWNRLNQERRIPQWKLWHHFHQNKDWNSPGWVFFFFGSCVMTPLPPKQGLKRNQKVWKSGNPCCYDTTSTKTRIETTGRNESGLPPSMVMTPLPPKQGLKRIPFWITTSPSWWLWHHFHQNKDWNKRRQGAVEIQPSCYDTTSTKTRIETRVPRWQIRYNLVMTPLPPKQGLKLRFV